MKEDDKSRGEPQQTLKRVIGTFSYIEDYPQMREFIKPWEFSIQVVQGGGKISTDNTPLQSSGFSKCSALILKDTASGQAALFHVYDIDLEDRQSVVVQDFIRVYIENFDVKPEIKNKLMRAALEVAEYNYPKTMSREEFQKMMEDLNKDGLLKAQYVVASDGRNIRNRLTGSLLDYLGIKMDDDIIVNAKNRWAIVYKPEEAKIFIDHRQEKKVFIYDF